MFRKSLRAAICALAVFSLTACTEDTPTELGDDVLSGGDLITFEVVLPAASFLELDTSFTGYADAEAAPFGYVARIKDGAALALQSNQLYRFSLPPRVVVVRNTTTNALQADSAPVYFAGQLVLKLDTIVTPGVTPARFALHRTAEEWDGSATWDLRVDTGAVELPWQTPGGTRGLQIDTASLVGGDSIVFDVDSATIAMWRDTADVTRGALITAETDGGAVRILSSTVRLSARSAIRPDTTLTFSIVPTHRTFIFNPVPPKSATQLRVGGLPAWRSILRLKQNLGTLTFPCPGTTTSCTINLDSANITLAELLLKPSKPPAGYMPEDTVFVDVRGLTLSPLIPLERSPIGNRVAISSAIGPQQFANPSATDIVRINITQFIAHLTGDLEEEDKLPPILTLMALPEPSTFGFVAFEPGPSLRLILTTTARSTPND